MKFMFFSIEYRYREIHKLHLFCWWKFQGTCNQKINLNRAEPTCYRTNFRQFWLTKWSFFVHSTTRNLILKVYRTFLIKYIVCTSPSTVEYRFASNFTDVLFMIWSWTCSLDIINRLSFVIVFTKALLLSRWIDSGHLVWATPLTTLHFREQGEIWVNVQL